MPKRLKIAAILLVAAIVSWLMLPNRAPISSIRLAIGFKWAVFLLAAAVIACLLWLAEPFWDVPRFFYRRFLGPYVRLRRMRHKRHDREWQEAAARNNDRPT
jgi:hypothetical protein